MTTRDDFNPRKCDSFAIPTQLTRADSSDDKSAHDITSGVHTNAHEDAFSAPRTNVRLVAGFGAFKVRRAYACALLL